MRRRSYNLQMLDAAENLHFARELEFVKATAYERNYPELKGRSFVPVDNTVDPGAEFITYSEYDRFGIAKIVANYADDLPAANVKGKQTTSPIKTLGVSYRYSRQDVRASRYSGKSLEQREANAARLAFEEKVDEIAAIGNTEHGLTGLVNNANVPVLTVGNGGAGTTPWADKTASEMLADLNAAAIAIPVTTRDKESPDTLILPLTQYARASSLPMWVNGGDTTVLQFFLKNTPTVKNVFTWQKLVGAGAGSLDRAVMYKNDPEKLQLIIPLEFQQLAPQERNLAVVVPCEGRIGGVLVYAPLSMLYIDGI